VIAKIGAGVEPVRWYALGVLNAFETLAVETATEVTQGDVCSHSNEEADHSAVRGQELHVPRHCSRVRGQADPAGVRRNGRQPRCGGTSVGSYSSDARFDTEEPPQAACGEAKTSAEEAEKHHQEV
jgi:hypothetical protein